MKKILYTIGDSWTYGTELDFPHRESYPYLLSQKLDCDLVNEALPAASNDWIFRKSIEWIVKNDTSNIHTFIVGWSSMDQREEQFRFFHGGPPKLERLRITADGYYDPVSKWISERLYNARFAAIKSFTYMYTLQEILKKNNINYIFYFPWEELLLQDEWYDITIKNDVHDIYLQIDKDYCIGPLDISSKNLHPDKVEHKFMTKQLYEFIIGRKK